MGAVAVVPLLLDWVVDGELVVEPDATVNVTGTEIFPPFLTETVTVPVYLPAANPVGFTPTESCAEFVRLPVVGDTLTHVALSLLLQLSVRSLFLRMLTIWLGGLVPPCTA
jgi:hypothetical protein